MARWRVAQFYWACAGVVAGLATMGGNEAMAQTPSASFPVSATIVSGCEVNGTLAAGTQSVGQMGTLSFGTHSALSTATLSAALVQDTGLIVRCTPGVTMTMTIDGGLHNGATRAMLAPANATRIGYRIYRDAGFTQEVLVNQAVPVSFSSGVPITVPIYGRLTLAGALPAGAYADTVLVTLNW